MRGRDGVAADVPVPSRAMFERTALPAGPRVISARLPGARSVSIAAYVLAGSRLETPGRGRRRPLHGAHHLQGHGAATRRPGAISEAIEGVGGSFNAATDRESTVYWVRVPRREASRAMDVLGELIVRPTLDDDEIDGERDGHRRGDPLVPRRPGRVRPDPLPAGDVRRRRRSAARSAATRTGIRALPARDDPRLLARRPTGRRTRSSRWPATSTHDGGGRPRGRRRSGPATASIPAFDRGARRCPPASAASSRAARRGAGPARHRRAGAPARPPGRVDPRGAQRGPRRRDVAAGCSSPSARRWASPTTSRRARRLRRRRRARGLGRRRSGAAAGGARTRSSRELARLRDELSPGERAATKAKALPLRRARAADGRDAPPGVVDRRPGGAPRPGPHARRGARGGRAPSASADVRRLARELFTDEGCGRRSSRPAPAPPRARAAACGCRVTATVRGCQTLRSRRRTSAAPTWSSPASHLRMGSLGPARAGWSARRPQRPRRRGSATLAEVRWRNRRPARGRRGRARRTSRPALTTRCARTRPSPGEPRPAWRPPARRPGAGRADEPLGPDLRGDAPSPIWPVDPGAPVEPVGRCSPTCRPKPGRDIAAAGSSSFLTASALDDAADHAVARRRRPSGPASGMPTAGARRATLPSRRGCSPGREPRVARRPSRPGRGRPRARACAPIRRWHPRSSTCSPAAANRSSRSSGRRPHGSWATRRATRDLRGRGRGDEPPAVSHVARPHPTAARTTSTAAERESPADADAPSAGLRIGRQFLGQV